MDNIEEINNFIISLKELLIEIDKSPLVDENKRFDINLKKRKQVYFERFKNNSKTLAQIGKDNQISKQQVDKYKKAVKQFLSNKFNKENEKFNTTFNNLFQSVPKIIYVKNLYELEEYQNIIKHFLYDNNEKIQSNREFNIDFDAKIIFYKCNMKNNLYSNFIKLLKDKNIYSINELKQILKNELDKIGEIDSDGNIVCNQLLKQILSDKFKNNFIELKDKYYYTLYKLTKNQIKNIKFLYWFKTLYPNGIRLPQPINLTKENDCKHNLENLFNITGESKSQNYRAFITNRIVNEENIISYDTGFYVHIDYFKELYASNKIYLNQLADIIVMLTKNTGFPARQIFVDAKTEFETSGIFTHEILFNLLKMVEAKELICSNDLRTLKFLNAHSDKYDEKKTFKQAELVKLKEFLNNNKFNQTVKLTFDSPKFQNNESETLIQKDNNIREIQKIEEAVSKLTQNETEKRVLTKIRIGQSKLRTKLLKGESKCNLCGFTNEKLLIVSHIKPWAMSDNNEKLDKENVLLLCPMHDALFDKGYISFDNNGKIIISKKMSDSDQKLSNINLSSSIQITSEKQREYLKYHRLHQFIK
ncbi:MAG: HNH endonuclease [Clostridiaceae bacterium]|jgi:predicted restriction endonuclease|nr:HNH endonuclease [Clostridiaceae bacterium]